MREKMRVLRWIGYITVIAFGVAGVLIEFDVPGAGFAFGFALLLLGVYAGLSIEWGNCPHCHKSLRRTYHPQFCPHCGTKIDYDAKSEE